jgi:hypothetical protein
MGRYNQERCRKNWKAEQTRRIWQLRWLENWMCDGMVLATG